MRSLKRLRLFCLEPQEYDVEDLYGMRSFEERHLESNYMDDIPFIASSLLGSSCPSSEQRMKKTLQLDFRGVLFSSESVMSRLVNSCQFLSRLDLAGTIPVVDPGECRELECFSASFPNLQCLLLARLAVTPEAVETILSKCPLLDDLHVLYWPVDELSTSSLTSSQNLTKLFTVAGKVLTRFSFETENFRQVELNLVAMANECVRLEDVRLDINWKALQSLPQLCRANGGTLKELRLHYVDVPKGRVANGEEIKFVLDSVSETKCLKLFGLEILVSHRSLQELTQALKSILQHCGKRLNHFTVSTVFTGGCSLRVIDTGAFYIAQLFEDIAKKNKRMTFLDLKYTPREALTSIFSPDAVKIPTPSVVVSQVLKEAFTNLLTTLPNLSSFAITKSVYRYPL
eukprot:Plantae.Rhodophyta-Hildenbrandia_rubra.ctg6347.p1 GENE.Plantae.Rhodophyta-Hildenbrandia_rubra.ctg6347~~Plantae.Rhodophyta-Hildenbrandia_rubra.ctg6347.p1  ORF type:complete len:401 (-),score=40.12 Plantae.Rhodophyta-Hildenbrandia_rubra.ctg6347:665-1867(-)